MTKLSAIRRVVQRERFCGPATLEMMYSAYRLEVTQDHIARALGIDLETLSQNGSTIMHLSNAVDQIRGYALLVRYNASITDLEQGLLCDVPVGIEWRCQFREPNGSIWGEGHYSVIRHIDRARRILEVIDPFAGQNLSHNNGLTSFDDFVQNWWDENWFEGSNGLEQVFTKGLMFILVPVAEQEHFLTMGFKRVTNELPFQYRTAARRIELPTRPDMDQRILAVK